MTAFLLFFVNLVASLVYLVKRNPKVDALAMVSAEVGVVFCTVVLVTGRSGRGRCGHLVDLGRAPDLDAGIVADLPRYLLLRRFSDSAQAPVLAPCSLSLALSISPWSTFPSGSSARSIAAGNRWRRSIDPRMWRVLLINWMAFLCFALLMVGRAIDSRPCAGKWRKLRRWNPYWMMTEDRLLRLETRKSR